MTDEDLYNAGWRQGSIFLADLAAPCLEAGAEPKTARTRTLEHGRWVVCTQDCDLRQSATDSPDVLIEVRPVFEEDPPSNWGIRSRQVRLTDAFYVDAAAPRLLLTASLLSHFHSDRLDTPSADRMVAFKTWLGLRYDRPAVPESLVPVAAEVARRCGTKSGRSAALRVHDVLMQFNEESDPPQVALFAVVVEDSDREPTRKWLAEAATRVRPEVCVIAHIDVGTKSEVPLELVETSYAADLSQLTWSGESPTGAL